MMRLQLPSATPTPDRLPDPDPILPPVSRSSPPRAEGILLDHATAVLLTCRSRQSLPAACIVLAAGEEPCMAAGGGTLYGCTGRILHGYMEGTLQETFMVRLHCLSF